MEYMTHTFFQFGAKIVFFHLFSVLTKNQSLIEIFYEISVISNFI